MGRVGGARDGRGRGWQRAGEAEGAPRRVLEQLRGHAVLDPERPLTEARLLEALHGRGAQREAQLCRGRGHCRGQLASVADDDELLGSGRGQGAQEGRLRGLRPLVEHHQAEGGAPLLQLRRAHAARDHHRRHPCDDAPHLVAHAADLHRRRGSQARRQRRVLSARPQRHHLEIRHLQVVASTPGGVELGQMSRCKGLYGGVRGCKGLYGDARGCTGR